MGYYVRELREKQSEPRWKLQFVSYRKEHNKGSKAIKPKREWDVDSRRARALGFHRDMTVREAKARQRQLNQQLRQKRWDERREEEEFVRKDFNLRHGYAFPKALLRDFEQQIIRGRCASSNYRKSMVTGWTVAKRVIVAVDPDPSNWRERAPLFYEYFAERSWSICYVRRILRLINLWGHFICRKLGWSFLEIQPPRGYFRAQIYEAYFSRLGGHSKASQPLTPEALERARERLPTEYYNWLYISVWTGLRPQEIDQLKNSNLLRFEKTATGEHVLWVYQTKIVSLPHNDRWKPIPLISDEQRRIMAIIESQEFSRPSPKIIKSHLGQNIGLYGGRKGFTDLMLSRGQPLEFICQWMGHSSIDRTWRSYKNRQRFHYWLHADRR